MLRPLRSHRLLQSLPQASLALATPLLTSTPLIVWESAAQTGEVLNCINGFIYSFRCETSGKACHHQADYVLIVTCHWQTVHLSVHLALQRLAFRYSHQRTVDPWWCWPLVAVCIVNWTICHSFSIWSPDGGHPSSWQRMSSSSFLSSLMFSNVSDLYIVSPVYIQWIITDAVSKWQTTVHLLVMTQQYRNTELLKTITQNTSGNEHSLYSIVFIGSSKNCFTFIPIYIYTHIRLLTTNRVKVVLVPIACPRG